MFIKYNSTGQFSNVVKAIRDTAKYNNLALPKIKFRGTVKIHGTNSGFVYTPSTNEITIQSRERELSLESDNAGFCQFVLGTPEVKQQLINFSNEIFDQVEFKDVNDSVQIYGEWFGPGIHSGVGVNQLSQKHFAIFKVRVGTSNELKDFVDFQKAFEKTITHDRIHSMNGFETFEVEVDFEVPALSQNTFIELTTKVADDCPVARKMLPNFKGNLLGEGIVWSAEPTGIDHFDKNGEHMFKTKDERHSVSKIKTVAPVDPVKVKGIQEFVEYSVTENRLNQGIDYLNEMNIPLDQKSTGDYIKWVIGDILKEELETLVASGFTMKEVSGDIARKARTFFLGKVNTV